MRIVRDAYRFDGHRGQRRGQAAGAAGQDPNSWCDGRNRDGYRAGHAWGLASFCTSENGWQAGWKEQTAKAVCRGVNGDAYQRGHRIGSSARDTQDELDTLAKKIRQLEADQAAATDATRRAQIADRLREAYRDQRQLRDQLGRLQIYVSRGTGYWGPPKRLGAPSEIAELRLSRSA